MIKKGWIYFLESVRPDGKTQIYIGQTTRSVSKRFDEHVKSIGNKKKWVGQGSSIKFLGAIPSSNIDKAERSCKKMSPAKKRKIASFGADFLDKKVE